jgi:hypothetical protein
VNPYLERDAHALAKEADELKAENERLRAAVETSIAFIAGWAGSYQSMHQLADLHPEHMKAMDEAHAALGRPNPLRSK